MTAPRYMSLSSLAAALDVGERTIETWVAQGSFPAPVKIGPNGTKRWRWQDIETHIAGEKTDVQIEGKITHGTREARHERFVRRGHQGLSGITKVSEPGRRDATELPPHAESRRTP